MKIRNPISSIFNMLKKKTERIKTEKQKEFEEIEKLDQKIQQKKEKIPELNKLKLEKYNLKDMLSFWLIWIFALYLWYVLFNTLELLYLIIAAYIISIAMEVLIDGFQKILPRIWSIIVSYVLLLLLLISGFVVVIPFVIAQSADIVQSLVDVVYSFQDDLKKYWLEHVITNTPLIPAFMEGFIIEQMQDTEILFTIQMAIQQNINEIASWWSWFINNVGSIVVSIVSWFFSALFQILLVFVLAIFFSTQKDWVINLIGSLWGKKDYIVAKMHKLYRKLWFWLKWQFLLAIFIFVTVFLLLNTVALFWIDLPNKFTLALIAWLTEFIPMVWPVLWAIPALLIAVHEYWFVWFLIIGLIYLLIQWFENYVLVPIVMNQALWINPLLIIVAMLIWGSLMWFVWIVLSVPIAVIVSLIFEDIIKSSDVNEKEK